MGAEVYVNLQECNLGTTYTSKGETGTENVNEKLNLSQNLEEQTADDSAQINDATTENGESLENLVTLPNEIDEVAEAMVTDNMNVNDTETEEIDSLDIEVNEIESNADLEVKDMDSKTNDVEDNYHDVDQEETSISNSPENQKETKENLSEINKNNEENSPILNTTEVDKSIESKDVEASAMPEAKNMDKTSNNLEESIQSVDQDGISITDNNTEKDKEVTEKVSKPMVNDEENNAILETEEVNKDIELNNIELNTKLEVRNIEEDVNDDAENVQNMEQEETSQNNNLEENKTEVDGQYIEPNMEEDTPVNEEKSASLKESDKSKKETYETIKEIDDNEKETEKVLEKANEEPEDITIESVEVNIENEKCAVIEQCESLDFDETNIEDESQKEANDAKATEEKLAVSEQKVDIKTQ